MNPQQKARLFPAGPSAFPDFSLLALLAVALYLGLSFGAWQQDTWFYLKSGEAMVTQGGFPQHDLFGQGTEARPWPRSAWSFSVMAHLVARAWGLDALVLARIILSTAGLLLIAVLFRRRQAPWALAVALTLLLFLGTRYLWNERPHTGTFVLLPLALAALSRVGWRRRLALGLIALVWSNLHDSSVLFGVLLGAWLLTETIFGKPWREAAYDAGAAALGLLCNPGLAEPWLRVWRWYSSPNAYRATIQEWSGPQGPETVLYLAPPLLALLLVAKLRGQAERSWRQPAFLWVLLLGVLSLSSRRYWPYSLICGLYFAAQALPRLFPKAPWRPLAWALLLGTLGSASLDPALGKRGILWEKVPRGAAEFLAQEAPAGRLAHTRWDGDYLLWRLGPEQKVFIDSRLDLVYPYARMAHEESIFGGSASWRESLQGYGISAVLLPRLPQEAPLAPLLEADPQWRLVYLDPVSRIYARQGENGARGGWPQGAKRR